MWYHHLFITYPEQNNNQSLIKNGIPRIYYCGLKSHLEKGHSDYNTEQGIWVWELLLGILGPDSSNWQDSFFLAGLVRRTRRLIITLKTWLILRTIMSLFFLTCTTCISSHCCSSTISILNLFYGIFVGPLGSPRTEVMKEPGCIGLCTIASCMWATILSFLPALAWLGWACFSFLLTS